MSSHLNVRHFDLISRIINIVMDGLIVLIVTLCQMIFDVSFFAKVVGLIQFFQKNGRLKISYTNELKVLKTSYEIKPFQYTPVFMLKL